MTSQRWDARGRCLVFHILVSHFSILTDSRGGGLSAHTGNSYLMKDNEKKSILFYGGTKCIFREIFESKSKRASAKGRGAKCTYWEIAVNERSPTEFEFFHGKGLSVHTGIFLRREGGGAHFRSVRSNEQFFYRYHAFLAFVGRLKNPEIFV